MRTRDQLSRDQLPHDQLLQYQLFMKSTLRSTLMKSEEGQAVGVDLAKVDFVCATRVCDVQLPLDHAFALRK